MATVRYDPERTWHAAENVTLVVEVVSEESADRDRLKLAVPFPLDINLNGLLPPV